MSSNQLIPYYRVSTKGQGESGLGLEAQEAAIRAHGGAIVASYTEIESGTHVDRPELQRALAHARRARATLIVAKLDRLARNVAFLAALMESGVDFVACDQPSANRFTLHILAAVAEEEARLIGERTKAALAAAKARGKALGANRVGSYRLTDEDRAKGRQKSSQRLRHEAVSAYRDVIPMLRNWASEGLTCAGMAKILNEEGYRTRRGCLWTAVQVIRVLAMAPA
jgi:DNA invertase Pin-like site-specific DNA recombinase